eukprot:403360719
MSDTVDLQKALQHKYEPYDVTLTNNEIMLYAATVGFSQDPLNEQHLRFTYENHENFSTFSTMASVIAHRKSGELFSVPGTPPLNPMMLLYGEENIQILKPITGDQTLRIEERIADIADKGKMIAVTEESLIKNKETGELLVKILRTLIIRGVKDFGTKGKTPLVVYPAAPKRTPDNIAQDKTQANQAILYRLNGDYNPLHVDKGFAEVGGFERPILHGLCTYGFTARMIYDTYCNGDPNLLKSFNSRFVSHVYPGETLIVESWKEGNIIVFQTKTKERGLVCLRGFAELREQPKL